VRYDLPPTPSEGGRDGGIVLRGNNVGHFALIPTENNLANPSPLKRVRVRSRASWREVGILILAFYAKFLNLQANRFVPIRNRFTSVITNQ
jgi:hypothetical protein